MDKKVDRLTIIQTIATTIHFTPKRTYLSIIILIVLHWAVLTIIVEGPKTISRTFIIGRLLRATVQGN